MRAQDSELGGLGSLRASCGTGLITCKEPSSFQAFSSVGDATACFMRRRRKSPCSDLHVRSCKHQGLCHEHSDRIQCKPDLWGTRGPGQWPLNRSQDFEVAPRAWEGTVSVSKWISVRSLLSQQGLCCSRERERGRSVVCPKSNQ